MPSKKSLSLFDSVIASSVSTGMTELGLNTMTGTSDRSKIGNISYYYSTIAGTLFGNGAGVYNEVPLTEDETKFGLLTSIATRGLAKLLEDNYGYDPNTAISFSTALITSGTLGLKFIFKLLPRIVILHPDDYNEHAHTV